MGQVKKVRGSLQLRVAANFAPGEILELFVDLRLITPSAATCPRLPLTLLPVDLIQKKGSGHGVLSRSLLELRFCPHCAHRHLLIQSNPISLPCLAVPSHSDLASGGLAGEVALPDVFGVGSIDWLACKFGVGGRLGNGFHVERLPLLW